MPLTNANRVRHAQLIANMLNKVISGTNKPLKRIGTNRTADGAAFLLNDPRKVGKIVFFKTRRDFDRIING